MNPKEKGARRHLKGLKLWTRDRALAAVPYLRQVVTSLRDLWLELCRDRLRSGRLASRAGRPGRRTMLLQQDAAQEVHRAEQQFEDTVRELHALNVACQDPLHGIVLLPFVQRRKLGWLIFDLFDVEPFRYWRYQDDDTDVRRPIGGDEAPK